MKVFEQTCSKGTHTALSTLLDAAPSPDRSQPQRRPPRSLDLLPPPQEALPDRLQ